MFSVCVVVAALAAACQAGVIGGGVYGGGVYGGGVEAYGHGHAEDYYVSGN